MKTLSHRWTWFLFCLILTFSLTAQSESGQQGFFIPGFPKGVDEQDWKLAKGERVNDSDLRCIHTDHYIGGIDRHWALVMSGPPRNRFHYTFIEFREVTLRGTYEVQNGMVVFTGSHSTAPGPFEKKKRPTQTRPIRFSLNFRLEKDKVYFNVLQRDKKGNYQFQRKWFRSVGKDKWQPDQEMRITFIPQKKTKKSATFRIKGEWLHWPAGENQPQQKEIDKVVEYKNQGGVYWSQSPFLTKTNYWLPTVLRPSNNSTQLEEWPAFYHQGHNHFGWALGFTYNAPPKWEELGD